MNAKLIKTLIVLAFAVGASTTTYAQPNDNQKGFDLGKSEYESSCAACHGATGKGDGWYATRILKNVFKMSDLSQLSKNNNGVFPFSKVYDSIDGRLQVEAHGPKNMPIWGRTFSDEASVESPYYNAEAIARAKILALTEYVYRLQAK
jgi:hypothetical protein